MRLFLGVLLAAVTVPSPLTAQDDSRLVAAVRLAQDGQGDSARAAVDGLLRRTASTDTLYPQILYTAGLVARTTADRVTFFRRVSVEFATSSWADDALLALAREDFASGRAEAAARNLEKIKADYPSSPLVAQAAFWATRAYFELSRTAEACRWLAQGLALAGEDVELRNQLEFYAPRCQAAATDSAPRPAGPAGPFYAVQVAAVGSEASARTLASRLREAGYEPRLVQESGLTKVRVGRYTDRAQATAAAGDIRTRFGGSPFVVEEP